MAALALTAVTAVATLKAHPLETCDLCFSMRAGDRWVSRSAADELSLDGPERLSFWRVYPSHTGAWPEVVLFEATIPGRDGYRAVRSGEDGVTQIVPFEASWSTCTRTACAGFLYHVASSPEALRDWTADGVFPAVSMIGACDGANCSYLQPRDPAEGADVGAGGALVLGPAAQATEFEFVCEPCPDGIGGAALYWTIALLSLVASIPSVVALRARMQRRGTETLPATAWPVAKRPAYIWAFMQVCWLMVVGGATPMLLWAVRAASSSESDGGSLALSIMGLAGIQMCLRDDDHPAALRTASFLVACAAVGGIWAAFSTIQINWYLLTYSPADGGGGDGGAADGSGAAALGAAALWPFRNNFVLHGAIYPSILGGVLEATLCAVLAAAQFPLHRAGPRRLRDGEALRWLWLTTRTWSLLMGVVILAVCAAAGVTSLACRRAYPSERRRVHRLVGALLPMAAALLLAAAVTTPGVPARSKWRLCSATSGHHRLIRLHLKAWPRSPHS